MTVVRYPLPHWPEELDEHERSIEEQSWESDTPVIAGGSHADILARKLDRIEELHADNEADVHPSFERIARAQALATGCDALGANGAELVAGVIEREPRWHSWVIMWVCWPIAALLAVGVMVAVVG
jgi:hypothetical protein